MKVATLILVWGKALLLLATPFTVAGVIVSLALTRSPYPIGLTYAVDLIGAAFGCLLVLPLLHQTDAASATMFVAALVALAGICFRKAQQGAEIDGTFPNWRVLGQPHLIMAILVFLAAINSVTRYGFQPISAKLGAISVGTNFEYEKWNSFSRVLATRSEVRPVFLWGPSSTLLVIYLLTLPSWLPSLASSVEAGDVVTRALSSVAIIFPAGLLMGFGFPFGMRLVTKQDPRPTPWFWGINGAVGVLAAGLAVACSMTLSIDTTMRVGALCYLLLGPTVMFLMGRERWIALEISSSLNFLVDGDRALKSGRNVRRP